MSSPDERYRGSYWPRAVATLGVCGVVAVALLCDCGTSSILLAIVGIGLIWGAD